MFVIHDSAQHIMQTIDDYLQFDRQHIWHPYSSLNSQLPIYAVESAQGVNIRLRDGRELIDGMASWWSVIHGYKHPEIDQALKHQIDQVSHVMFGGLTHQPAIDLAAKLIAITHPSLQAVFFADSGSVAVEVALKMAIQYQAAIGQKQRQHFLSLRHAYHGDTFGAMSVCDPVNGMHSLFTQALSQQFFIEQPQKRFHEVCETEDFLAMQQMFEQHHKQIAGLIMEPIVQGAGGMWFYSADYLKQARELCDHYGVLLIFDEIATGFGRSGKLFAYEHANIAADILCLGKALTGGYMSLAATLCNQQVHQAIDNGEPGVFMHGPTFMANPLACAAANASIELLLKSAWQTNIQNIEQQLIQSLTPLSQLPSVADVRVLGAIAVVEMKQVINMQSIVPQFVQLGVWLRPFGKLIYIMPPYTIKQQELEKLTSAMTQVISNL
ncbi:MAG: adenosylmethionine--8-amino-7-oxononanoate transaminase [Gammaproteobacteria bacterium]|nr:adenosylmethionine--8-amino-7-oxononanoate transaminase [Gammaproteobacteria bacterium]MDH5730493.1 adenosylmethionine--8-amino-7-oxononanoate transaminase [Gammaproteobacteria bacterium]